MKTLKTMKTLIANRMFDAYMSDSSESMNTAFLMISTTATIFETNLDQFNRNVADEYNKLLNDHRQKQLKATEGI